MCRYRAATNTRSSARCAIGGLEDDGNERSVSGGATSGSTSRMTVGDILRHEGRQIPTAVVVPRSCADSARTGQQR
jgi:hypothetical protein